MRYKYQFFTDTGCIEHISKYELNIFHHFQIGFIWFEEDKLTTHYINMNQVRNVLITKLEGIEK
ncbi:hypothetical protein QF028_001603 [Neobacillus sp. B4I6]